MSSEDGSLDLFVQTATVNFFIALQLISCLDVFVDRFPEGPGGELNVKQRRFQAPAGFNLMFTPSQWYQDAGKR